MLSHYARTILVLCYVRDTVRTVVLSCWTSCVTAFGADRPPGLSLVAALAITLLLNLVGEVWGPNPSKGRSRK